MVFKLFGLGGGAADSFDSRVPSVSRPAVGPYRRGVFASPSDGESAHIQRYGSPPAEYAMARGVVRAMRRRCPVCGDRSISRHAVSIEQTCPHCGLDLERQVGAIVGGVGLNTIASLGVLLFTIVVGFIATDGDPTVFNVLLPALGLSILVPLIFFARSRLLWVALELRWWPLKPGEVDLDR